MFSTLIINCFNLPGNVDSRKNRVQRTGTRSSASASTAGAAATKTTVASTVPAAATAAASSAAHGSAAAPMDITGDDAPARTKKGNKRARSVQAGNTPASAVRVKVETTDMQATSTQPNGSVKSEAAAADVEEALKERARKRKLQQKKKVMLENVIKPKAMIEASRKRQKRSSTPTAAAPVAVKPEAPAWSVAPGAGLPRPPVSRGMSCSLRLVVKDYEFDFIVCMSIFFCLRFCFTQTHEPSGCSVDLLFAVSSQASFSDGSER